VCALLPFGSGMNIRIHGGRIRVCKHVGVKVEHGLATLLIRRGVQNQRTGEWVGCSRNTYLGVGFAVCGFYVLVV